MGPPRPVVALALLAAAWLGAACSGDDDAGLDRQAGASTTVAPSTSTTSTGRPRGGAAVVAVWEEPDPAAPTLGGAAVRSLVLPQLYVAQPDGAWVPSLVEAGSEREAPDLGSVSFVLVRGAAWSDGSPITADDLRRSADPRFVAGVDGPDAAGRVTVRFTQRLPGWRRLWSGVDSVAPPAPGVWGGPFVVAGRTPGLEVVLRPNPEWHGAAPFLDEVRLQLVPDVTMALQLFERGDVDVVAPLPFPARIQQLAAVDGARVETGRASASGWWTGLLFQPGGLDGEDRRAVVASIDRRQFVGSLLKDEARVLDGFAGSRTWSSVGPGDPGALRDDVVDLVGMEEEPLTGLLQRSMQLRVRGVDARLELRNAEAHIVQGWVAAGEYEAAVVATFDSPTLCWLCRWGSIDEERARRADAGDAEAAAELETRLRDEALLLPLWRARPVVAWLAGLSGVEVNGYGLSPAWNAEQWWRE